VKPCLPAENIIIGKDAKQRGRGKMKWSILLGQIFFPRVLENVLNMNMDEEDGVGPLMLPGFRMVASSFKAFGRWL
jgi:hypothetical protein